MGGATTNDILANAVAAAVTSLGFYLMMRMANQRWAVGRLAKEMEALQAELAHERQKRASDRAGRIRAEKALREAELRLVVAAAASSSSEASASAGSAGGASLAAAATAARTTSAPSSSVYPFRPIGYLQSCFSARNGTPRQPLLVPAARAVLKLAPGVPPAALEGLEQYSHCWVLYVFHANTDIAKVLSGAGASVKGKIRVPRLDGGRMGVLATRSPHRPAPIGLSVAQVMDVAPGRLLLGGADIVDGSPVLDVKPYVPFCDSIPDARAPGWVAAEAAGGREPLALGGVGFAPGAEASVRAAWEERARSHSGASASGGGGGGGGGRRRRRAAPLYGSAEEFVELVQQVLARDIRSVHQRLNVQPPGAAAPTSSGEQAPSPPQQQEPGEGQETTSEGRYHVVLDGIDVSYDILAGGEVLVRRAAAAASAQAGAAASDAEEL